ncbi:MAG: LytR family transcriptional regulator, partial [Nocardioidaceae bacterium]|nr:LytR family transcriptional regulator [Nocardioidaceae bacterium]
MAGHDDENFDWIYGAPDASGPPAADPRDRGGRPAGDPEPTRRLPVQQPPPDPRYQRPTGPGGPAEPTGRPPGGAPPSGPRFPRRSRWHRPRTYLRLLIGLIFVWLVFLIAVPIVTWKRVDKVDFEPDGDRPGQQPGTTSLLV